MVQLPKATKCKLLALSADFVLISDMRALLESHLRQNYTTIYLNQKICVSLQDFDLAFKVAELLPSDAALVINTDIEVEIQAESGIVADAAKRKLSEKSLTSLEWNLFKDKHECTIKNKLTFENDSDYYAVKNCYNLSIDKNYIIL